MKTSESILKLTPDLIKAHAEMPNIKRNAENPFFKSTYADLAQVLATTREILGKHKLAAIQFAEKSAPNLEGQAPVIVITRLIHESGEWIETEVASYASLKSAQEYGSVVTYLRRYALMAICGTAAEDDDDGELAEQKTPNPLAVGKSKQPKTITIQERLDQLPQDLKDILAKANCNSFQQRYHLLNSVAWNLEAAKKKALAQIQGE